jgi:hypothetical protein
MLAGDDEQLETGFAELERYGRRGGSSLALAPSRVGVLVSRGALAISEELPRI